MVALLTKAMPLTEAEAAVAAAAAAVAKDAATGLAKALRLKSFRVQDQTGTMHVTIELRRNLDEASSKA